MPTPTPTETPTAGHNNPPTPIDEPFEALARLVDRIAEAGKLWKQNRPKIEDPEQAEKAGKFLKKCREATELIEGERDLRIRPLDADIAKIREQFKALLDLLQPHRGDVQSKVARWQAEQKAKAEEERRRLKKQAEDRLKQSANDLANATSAAEQAHAQAQYKAAEEDAKRAEHHGLDSHIIRIKGGGSIGSRTTLMVSVADITKVPYDWLIVDPKLMSKARKMLEADINAIPGLVLKSVTITTTRKG